ncbi:MAG: sensor histidine kinase [Planctomycetes bacterium]|nr:sensor histidine kinase [Planctomycetota bacterium]
MARLRTPPTSIAEKIDQLTARAEALENQLLQAQRLATLGTLSMGMAHEFNNLLMTIMNQADMALAGSNQEKMQTALQKTMACSEQASTMIRSMLGFARSTDNEVRCASAAELMREALALLGRDPKKDGIQVQLDLDESLAIEVAPLEMTQVLLNLIINARHAMSCGGGFLTLRVYRDNEYVALEVSDTGHGIDSDTMDRLFEPFFTTRTEEAGGGGTGLGLWLSRKIARQYHGDVSVISSPGQGATFTVYVPAAE